MATEEPLDIIAGAPIRRVTVGRNELRVFVETPELAAAMMADIRAARHRVWLECYIFTSDDVGRAVAAALEDRARAGLDVRVLYDAVGSQFTPAWFFASMAAAGVQVHGFHSLWEGLRRFRFLWTLNRRNHRKLLVIDDRVGYFGGMNVSATGDPPTPRSRAASSGGGSWRDVHLRLEGSDQAAIADSFSRSWRRAHGEPIRQRRRSYRRGAISARPEAILFYDSGPGKRFTRAGRVFARVLRNGRTSIDISMAYFVPVGRVLRALLAARRHGAQIRIVVPSRSDVPLVEWATRHLYRGLLRRGFLLFERQIRMLHSKVIVVDQEWTVIGSANLDARSLYFNLEFVAIIRSPEFARLMVEIIDEEIGQSERVTKEKLDALPWWKRTLAAGAYLLRWWL
ncbi:MAG: hypothetical protein KF708_03865 [Pirellulales bacterium]|nr:hypothetical protein [Pirellulales bacterium]